MPNSQSVRSAALSRLGRRDYSAQEMVRYLEGRGFAQNEVKQVVLELVSQKLIDDWRFAGILARYHAERGKGPAYIRSKLREKGVHLELEQVRSLLGAQEEDQYSELDAASRIVERRYPGCWENKNDAARAIQGLVRRGFSFEVARAAVFKRSES